MTVSRIFCNHGAQGDGTVAVLPGAWSARPLRRGEMQRPGCGAAFCPRCGKKYELIPELECAA
jgi:hypothetical protein